MSFAQARHIAGGELYYKYLSTNGNMITYEVTLRLFRDCQSLGPKLENERPTLNIYENGVRLNTAALTLSGSVETIQKDVGSIPCLVGNVSSCYEIAYYTTTINVAQNMVGYTLTASNCCRVNNIVNLATNGSGTTFVTEIPGLNKLPTSFNNSPIFNVKDTTLVCSKKKFLLDFGATDVDNDTLIFSLCDAYTNTGGSNPILALTPVPYGQSFNGLFPLGASLSINTTTGQITGIAPNQGDYVISVCVTEIRNGIPINNQKKDFILNVQDCDIADADLPDIAVNCTNFGMKFENQSTSSGITNYAWDFGVKDSTNDVSSLPSPTYIYPDTGTYKATLKIQGLNGCSAEDSMIVKVYPTFKAKFSVQGSCMDIPFIFKDLSTATYGTVTNWRWKFGDVDNPTKDTSTQKDPAYKYNKPSMPTVSLITESTKGCADTFALKIEVKDKPNLKISFKDTLICSIDTLPIFVTTDPGVTLSWQPNYNISNLNSNNPYVFPKDTTTYYITATINSCTHKDSAIVNVLDFITVNAMPDTTICQTDTAQLLVQSHALSYQWSNPMSLVNAITKNPLAFPNTTTKYVVNANLGKCQDKDSLTVFVYPYPKVNVSNDTSICFGSKANLRSTIVADNFVWQPTNSLIFSNTLNPIAGPSKTTPYTLTVFNNAGCTKKVVDTTLVSIIKVPPVFAGRDTSVILNQPLQLNAQISDASNLFFKWQPANWLNNVNSQSPIAKFTIPNNPDSITYKVIASSKEGCFSSDEIKVKVFITNPDIFIPDAFTPNNDGRNDIIRPIPVGITEVKYFRVFNRWGQLLFNTNQLGKGWDGTLNGLPQQAGTYIYHAEALDFTGKTVNKKGVFILIR